MPSYEVIIHGDFGRLCTSAEDGENLLSLLNRCAVALPAACGGRGVCGKCRIRIESGEIHGSQPDAYGMIHACRSTVCGPLTLTVPSNRGQLQGREQGLTLLDGASRPDSTSGSVAASDSASPPAAPHHRYGMALDVGTTTLAAVLCDLDSGSTVATTSCLNPQSGFGADVISRIQAAGEGHLTRMRQNLYLKINEIIADFKHRFALDNKPLCRMTVCGNTTMMHIFAGVDPTPLGRYPFTPVFIGLRRMRGEDEGLDADEILLLPGAAAYIGSDLVCGLLATELTSHANTAFLADMGTNGEMALWHEGQLYCTSAAAGPALEGADISCGMGGVPGAVNRVYAEDGTAALHLGTIGDLPPAGICGCGLVELIALLLEHGIVDETGAMMTPDEENGSHGDPLCDRLCDKGFRLTELGAHPALYLTGTDVRRYQLAKGAIHTAAVILTKSAGASPEMISRVYIAGSLGFYLNQKSMLRTGILPSCFAGKMQAVGNTALQGAAAALLSPGKLPELERLGSSCRIIELNSHQDFMDLFIDSMQFAADAEVR